jgi:hypothetical protein
MTYPYTVLAARSKDDFDNLPTDDNVVIYFKMVSSVRYEGEEWINAIVVDDYKGLDRAEIRSKILDDAKRIGQLYSQTIISLMEQDNG